MVRCQRGHSGPHPDGRGRRAGRRRLRRDRARIHPRRVRLARRRPWRLGVIRAQLLRCVPRHLSGSFQREPQPPHRNVPVRQQRHEPVEHRTHPRSSRTIHRCWIRRLRSQPAQLHARHGRLGLLYRHGRRLARTRRAGARSGCPDPHHDGNAAHRARRHLARCRSRAEPGPWADHRRQRPHRGSLRQGDGRGVHRSGAVGATRGGPVHHRQLCRQR